MQHVEGHPPTTRHRVQNGIDAYKLRGRKHKSPRRAAAPPTPQSAFQAPDPHEGITIPRPIIRRRKASSANERHTHPGWFGVE